MSERFKAVRAAARRMAAEIEWCDVPGAGDAELAALLGRMAADPDVHDATRGLLDQMFAAVEGCGLFEAGDVEVLAAGLVQSAFKGVYRLTATPLEKAHVARVVALSWRTKFLRLATPVLQRPLRATVDMPRTTGKERCN